MSEPIEFNQRSFRWSKPHVKMSRGEYLSIHRRTQRDAVRDFLNDHKTWDAVARGAEQALGEGIPSSLHCEACTGSTVCHVHVGVAVADAAMELLQRLWVQRWEPADD